MALIQRPRDGALLVSEGANPSGALFHRPLGGHVECGEYALDTVNREFQEEIGQPLTQVQLAGVLENIFQWDGATQHEIVFIFTAAFADHSAYEIPEQTILDAYGHYPRDLAAARDRQPAPLPIRNGRPGRTRRHSVTAAPTNRATPPACQPASRLPAKRPTAAP